MFLKGKASKSHICKKDKVQCTVEIKQWWWPFPLHSKGILRIQLCGQETEDWRRVEMFASSKSSIPPSNMVEIFWLQKVLSSPEHLRFPLWTNTNHQRTKYCNKFQNFLTWNWELHAEQQTHIRYALSKINCKQITSQFTQKNNKKYTCT